MVKQILTLAAAVAVALTMPASAKHKRAAGFTEGTPVVVVGQISSPPKGETNEQKMQVMIGPERTDYTLHFRDAQLTGLHGQKIDEDGFDDGQWVRAEGTMMNDPRRIKVSRVQVIGTKEGGFRETAFGRPGFTHGYVMSVAGSRQTFYPESSTAFREREMTLVGRVSDDTGPANTTRKIQVEAAGNVWTLNVPKQATVLDAKGEQISVHEVDQGQWVRVTGFQTDDLRMRVTRMENIGPEEMFRKSSFFRTDWPMGYVEYGTK
jgi:hypothetical protein